MHFRMTQRNSNPISKEQSLFRLTQRSSNFYPYYENMHGYSKILKIVPPKYENFPIKKSDILHISAQNIDCGTH